MKAKKFIITLLLCLFAAALVGCGAEINAGKEIPLTDLAATYKGDATDTEGRLLAPFDVAYHDAFLTGEYKYDENVILIKTADDFSGKLTRDLKKCGIAELDRFASLKGGVWYRAALNGKYDATTAIYKARSLSVVLTADYDYIYETAALPEEGETAEINEADTSVENSSSTVEFFDEVYLANLQAVNQWYLGACGLQETWRLLKNNGISPGGDSSVIVAVIDTGVDYNHPDLKANMWKNTGEIPGNGIDDDNNGYIDDVHGVDVIANNGYADMRKTGDPMDDHGHGTHVAGIIAASNNREGIVGVAYNVKIMAVKAGQATGVFTQSDIAEAILYAYRMGADVINMSFGGSAISIPVQDALDQAYTTANLIAAAGNDGIHNEPFYLGIPSYPAALSYVTGVMSVDQRGVESVFTNWDFISYNNYEYEVYAPGESMLSTLPNGRYGYLSGTSMAAPVVSGISALLRSYFSDRDMYPSKFIAGQICSTSETSAICIDATLPDPIHGPHNVPMIVNAYTAFTKMPKPELSLYDWYSFDTVGMPEDVNERNNGDGVADSGETLYIAPVIRNRWGMSKNTVITVSAQAGIEGLGLTNPYVEIVRDSVDFDGVGTYSTKHCLTRDEEGILTGTDNPLIIRIARNCPNDYLIVLNFTITAENALDDDDHTTYISSGNVSFVVRNGVILRGQITEDQVWTKDNYYIIPTSLYIEEGVTVTVEPGTQIQFWTDDPNDLYADTYIAYINVAGRFITNGTVDEPVKLFPSEFMSEYRVEIQKSESGYVELNYTTVTNPYIYADNIDHCTFNKNYYGSLYCRCLSGGRVVTSDCNAIIHTNKAECSVFYKMNYCYVGGTFENCIFTQSGIGFGGGNNKYINCVFLGNRAVNEAGYAYNSSYTLNQYSNLSVDKIARNSVNGSTYIQVSSVDPADYNYFIQFAHYLGGELARIDTENEWAFLCSNGFSGYVDNASNDRPWFDENYTGSYGYSCDNQGGTDLYAFYYSGNYYGSKTYRGYLQFVSDNYRAYYIDYNNGGRCGNYAIIEIPGSVFADNILLNETEVTIDTDSSYRILPSAYPSTFDVNTLFYVSDDEKVATVNENGVVTPHSKGRAIIYVYSPDHLVYATLKLTVTEKVPLQKLELSVSENQLAVGGTAYLTPVLYPANTTEKFIEYTSSDPAVISVNDYGVITGVSVGSAVISAFVAGKEASVTVNVVRPVESVTFSQNIYATFVGDTDAGYLPVISPADATNKTLLWESSNPEVAYVNGEGQLVRVSEGTAVLRATVENTSLYAELTVCVTEQSAFNASKVVQMSESGGYILATLEDGSVWLWGGERIKVPKKIDYNISSAIVGTNRYGESYTIVERIVTYNPGTEYQFTGKEMVDVHYFFVDIYLYVIDSAGTLSRREYYVYIASDHNDLLPVGTTVLMDTTDYNLGNNLVKVFSHNNNIYVLTSEGLVYSQGDNSYGQLGDGTTTDKDTFVQANIYGIVDIAPAYGMVAMLNNKGEVYCFGGSGSRYTEATLVYSGAKRIYSNGYDYIYIETALGQVININSGICSVSVEPYYYYYHLSGDTVYKGTNAICEIPVAAEAFTFGELIYVRTESGELYGLGSNYYYQLADLTTTNSEVPRRIYFGISDNSSAPGVEGINIAENLLTEERIVIDFNAALKTGGAYGNISLTPSSGVPVGIRKDVHLDKFTLSPYGKLTNGESYVLSIPAGAFTDYFGNGTAEIVYSFTYYNDTAIELANATVSDGAVLTETYAYFTFDYTLAVSGDNYADISIVNALGAAQDIAVSLNDNRLTISASLDYGEYTLVLPEGALKDYVGGVNARTEINFTVAQVIKLVSANLFHGDSRVNEEAAFTFTFTDAYEGENFDEISLTDAYGEEVAINPALADNTLTISHGILTLGESYVLTVPAGALVDLIGNGNAEITVAFTVYAPPAVIYSSLENGAENVALNPEFRFTFNGEYTLNPAKITIEGASVAAAIEGSALTVNAYGLSENTVYTLLIQAGALTDERGAVNAETIIVFKTVVYGAQLTWEDTHDIAELLDIWEKNYAYNVAFHHNAILNMFTDTNVENWLRIIAADSSTKVTYGLQHNYWGTVNEEMIERQIVDFDDFQSLADINPYPYLTEAPENVWPFVTAIYLLNADGERVRTVSNERVTFVVEFNRDMDVNTPIRVRFGSSTPYAEYEVAGSFVTPRRWEGVYTLKTTIENGNQFFNVSGGCAADDRFMTLFEAPARFQFEIDTTAAMAMIMQGEATDAGINLTWEQDDFDTLAGYNVYRSDRQDGYYQRLNSYVLAPDEKEFFDDTVEPGKIYYYNFTVVKTDLSESTPSGKIVIMSKDTMAPDIYHSPVRTAYTGSKLLITATITDNLQITEAKVYYRVKGTEEWRQTGMSALNSNYTAQISAEYITLEGLEYYIDAFDGITHTYKGRENPFEVTVKLAVDASALGDVDGDGIITTKDALMVLYASNDKLNLSEEQFLRADLNGDGELSAVEVLRILMYVNGSVTTIN
ncbi:MAG: S8 family serine peptidase [Clostridia bacterium]|nr:S8 family serine peptidase [Clostridia bacterium]